MVYFRIRRKRRNEIYGYKLTIKPYKHESIVIKGLCPFCILDALQGYWDGLSYECFPLELVANNHHVKYDSGYKSARAAVWEVFSKK